MSSASQTLNTPTFPSEPATAGASERRESAELSRRLPCVLYEATASLEITGVSEGIQELLGLDGEAVLNSHSFWDGFLFECDLPAIDEKLAVLESAGSVSFVHRMFNTDRLPIWVAHSIVKDDGSGKPCFRGCLVPILDDRRIFGLDPTLIDRFVHKLGNHFQLLNLIIGSLKKNLPPTRDSDILLETLDKAVELTRCFAEANQITSWLPEVQIAEVLKGILESHQSVCLDKRVSLSERIDEELNHAKLAGDPFLLEAALSHVLMEVLDAADNGEAISVTASVAHTSANAGVAKLRFQLDHELASSRTESVTRGEQSSKKNHDGMGMPLAARCVEMHGGLLATERAPSGIRVVEVSLPISLLSRAVCA